MKNWPIGELLPLNNSLFIKFVKKISNLVDQDNFSDTQQSSILVHSKYDFILIIQRNVANKLS